MVARLAGQRQPEGRGVGMNIGAGAVANSKGKSQLSLPLGVDPLADNALRAAWARSGLPIPYHVALQNRPLSICLSCLADAMRRRKLGLKR